MKQYFNISIEDINNAFKNGIKYIKGYNKGTREIYFYCKNGKVVRMYHQQDCCETVELYDDDGLGNGVDIFTDSEYCHIDIVSDKYSDGFSESATWTFIKFKTNKGYDTMRWLGESNGYYSESVDFEIYEGE